MLVFGCFFLMGSYFCFDNPTPIQTILEQPPYNLSLQQWAALFEVYSLPNMILPLFGGLFLDKVGMRPGLLLFTIVLTIGQFVFALGGLKNNFLLMCAGRFIFGLGGESMTVAQSTITSVWFKGKEFSFAMGLTLSVSRLGSVLNSLVLPIICNNHLNAEGYPLIGAALFVGFGICLFSLACGVLLVVTDWYADKKDGKADVAMKDDEKFRFSDIKSFGLSYWLITFSCLAVYMCCLNYLSQTPKILEVQYGFSVATAGALYGVPYYMSAILSPILGIVIDKVGMRSAMITSSSILCMIACLWNAFAPTYTEPSYMCMPSLVILGLGYSIYGAALWSCIPYTVPARCVGTAYGLTTAIQNIGMTLGPQAITQIQGHVANPDDYKWSMIFLAGCAFLGFLINVWLMYNDFKNCDGILYKVDKGTTVTELMTSPTAP